MWEKNKRRAKRRIVYKTLSATVCIPIPLEAATLQSDDLLVIFHNRVVQGRNTNRKKKQVKLNCSCLISFRCKHIACDVIRFVTLARQARRDQVIVNGLKKKKETSLFNKQGDRVYSSPMGLT